MLETMAGSHLGGFSIFILGVRGLTFRHWIHFELIFICGYNGSPLSFFCMWISSFPNTSHWRNCSFPVDPYWCPCQRVLSVKVRVCFWALPSVPLIYVYLYTSKKKKKKKKVFFYCSFIILVTNFINR